MEQSSGRAWRRPVRFVLVGALNTLTGLAAIYFGKFVLGLADVPANALGYALGLAVSFWGNAAWTFEYRGRLGPGALRYLAVFAVAYAANLSSLLVLRSAGIDGSLAQAVSVVPYAVTFYALSKVFVFAR
jgi:putative flippase GtrA